MNINQKGMYHIPVLKNEIETYFVSDEYGTYLDVTVGGGGHALALLEKYPNINLVLCDWDYTAICHVKTLLSSYLNRVRIIHTSFEMLSKKLKQHSVINKFNGILADFGTSSYQVFNQPGFSFQYDSYLDMRMSNGFSKMTAADILRNASEKELADIFYYYGQEKYARKIAKKIIDERANRPIKTSLHLVSLICSIIPKNSKIHPATKIFQSLRIAVNRELQQIESLLSQVPSLLQEGGRLACISFHSLEDALVKKFYKDHSKEYLVFGNDKIITPTKEELKLNPASRSAKLRILEKKFFL